MRVAAIPHGVMVSVPFTKTKLYLVAASVPAAAVMVYVPAVDDVVAVVVRLAAPVVAVATVSPLTKPVMVSVKVGLAAP